MKMKSFEVSGSFKIGDEWKPYNKVIPAPNENQARERVFAVFGSKHRLKRRYITIQSVKMINGE
jgi:large subunit ribosomal protein LX